MTLYINNSLELLGNNFFLIFPLNIGFFISNIVKNAVISGFIQIMQDVLLALLVTVAV